MPHYLQGNPNANTFDDAQILVVVSQFNEKITGSLEEGAVSTLLEKGVSDENITVVRVPGAFEIPTVVSNMLDPEEPVFDAVICLGAVIRGETSHDQHINRAISLAMMEMGIETGIPIIFGVLTCNTLEQALARSCGVDATTSKDVEEVALGNKGVDCALAAVEMLSLLDVAREYVAPEEEGDED